jgi:hypothetical protein
MKGKISPSQVIRLLDELRGIRNNLKQLVATGDELNRILAEAFKPSPEPEGGTWVWTPDVQDDDDQEAEE